MTTDLRIWWRYQTLKFQARRWLSANDTAVLAARLLFRLNRYARVCKRWGQYGSRDAIYQVKTVVIRYLYENGYCTAVTLQRQTLGCRACGGSGTYDRAYEGDCFKCGGTGIYREHILVRFVFNVAGQTYIWHQPQPLVDWPVRPDFAPITEYGHMDSYTHPDDSWMDRTAVELYLITLQEFARMNGREVEGSWHRLTLWGCVKTAVDEWWYERIERPWHHSKWYGRYRDTHRSLRRLWWFVRVRDLEEVKMMEYETDMYDDIPF